MRRLTKRGSSKFQADMSKQGYLSECREHSDLIQLWWQAANDVTREVKRDGKTEQAVSKIAELEGYRRTLRDRSRSLRQQGRMYAHEPQFPGIHWTDDTCREIAGERSRAA